MCDENGMPTAVYAVMLSALAALGVGVIRKTSLRRGLLFLGIPILYMACGSIGMAVYAAALIINGSAKKDVSFRTNIIVAVIAVAVAVACPIVASRLFNYTLVHLAKGLHYYRFGAIFPAWAWISAASMIAVWAASASMRPIRQASVRYAVLGVLGVAVALTTYKGVSANMDSDKEEAFFYDYMVRSRQWGKLLEKAREKHPDTPLTVQCLNLALAKTGMLPDLMFSFFQHDAEGLISPFLRDFTSPLPASEALYHLGFVNDSQRYAFEIQEAIPDFQKSVRCCKRLAETNLINGNYEAARKYLTTLQHTMFYDKWATGALALLGDEDAINANPEYGWLRKMRVKDDFFFNDQEMFSTLGLLFEATRANQTAYEYLMAWTLLRKDLKLFYQAYPLGKDLGYNHIPKSYQEALAMIWVNENKSWEGMPWSLSPQVMKGMESFLRDYNSSVPADVMKKRYAGTYWVYFLY